MRPISEIALAEIARAGSTDKKDTFRTTLSKKYKKINRFMQQPPPPEIERFNENLSEFKSELANKSYFKSTFKNLNREDLINISSR